MKKEKVGSFRNGFGLMNRLRMKLGLITCGPIIIMPTHEILNIIFATSAYVKGRDILG